MSTSDQPLQEYRVGIDSVDQQLVRLLNRRTELAIEAYQQNSSESIRAFEAKILDDISTKNPGPIPDTALRGIYRQILSGAFDLARRTRVGYLGPFGTFSHLAAKRYFGNQVDFENLRALEGVFEEVARGHVDFGLVPIENSTGGAIIETLDSFSSYYPRLTIYGESRLRIRFSLYSHSPVEQIKKVYSKAEALDQCHVWLSENCPNAELISYESTAAAVKFAYLADPNDGIAAIGSDQAIENWSPQFQGLESKSDNVTRFLILSKKEPLSTNNDKTSLMFTCADRPGSLVDILGVFKRNEINLSHIEKRPSREFGSEYTFFVDMFGHAKDERTAQILGEIRAHCKSLFVLGSFPVYEETIRYSPEELFEPIGNMEDLSRECDSIDSQIIDAINQRAGFVVKVGEFKRESNVPIYAPHRESAVLSKIDALNQGPLQPKTMESIYRELMSGSFRLEKPLRIGFVGPEGEFSHVAAIRHFGSSVDFDAARKIRSVFRHVADGDIDYGLVPVENSSVGSVNATLDAFIEFHDDLNIYGEVQLEQHFCLLADCRPEQVRKIYAKSSVFARCRNWLSTQYPHAQKISVESTLIATQKAKEEFQDKDGNGVAAIGSWLAGELNGLRPMFEAIEDRQGNTTRFLILSKSKTEMSKSDKTSIMFSTVDKSGALVDVLDVFKRNAVNLTHIEKRPSGENPWDYTFFVDLQGHRADPRVAQIVGEARGHCKNLTVLGSFPACIRTL